MAPYQRPDWYLATWTWPMNLGLGGLQCLPPDGFPGNLKSQQTLSLSLILWWYSSTNDISLSFSFSSNLSHNTRTTTWEDPRITAAMQQESLFQQQQQSSVETLFNTGSQTLLSPTISSPTPTNNGEFATGWVVNQPASQRVVKIFVMGKSPQKFWFFRGWIFWWVYLSTLPPTLHKMCTCLCEFPSFSPTRTPAAAIVLSPPGTPIVIICVLLSLIVEQCD